MKLKLLTLSIALAAHSAYGVDCTSLELWQSGKVYTSGMAVEHQGHKYTAKWWTQNQDPQLNSNTYSVWNDDGKCATDGGMIPPKVNWKSPANNSKVAVNTPITLSLNVDSKKAISAVEAFVNGTSLGIDNTAPYEFSWAAPFAGGYVLTAKATDEAGVIGESLPINLDAVNDDVITPPDGNFKIVGYFPSWQGVVSDIQFDKLTHINYSFLLPNADGSLQPLENLQKMKTLVTAAQAQGVKVGIAVGGWNGGNDSAFETFAASPAGRQAFIQNLLAFVEMHNLDGVDMDWEYPDPGQSAENYALLMNELSLELKARGKFLTAAVVALGYTGGGVLERVFQDVDFLNLMAYDANNRDHASYQYALDSIAYWQARGLPKEKTVLGVPFYSRPTWKAYHRLVAENPANACRDTDGSSFYNGIPTIRAKTELAMAKAGGIMNWELSHDTQDATSLLTAKWEVANGIAPSYRCQSQASEFSAKQCADIGINPAKYLSFEKMDDVKVGSTVRFENAIYRVNGQIETQPSSRSDWQLVCRF